MTRLMLPTISDRDLTTLKRGATAVAMLLLVSRGVPAWRQWTTEARTSAVELLVDAARSDSIVSLLPSIHDSLTARRKDTTVITARLIAGATANDAVTRLAATVADAASDAGVALGALVLHADTVGADGRPNRSAHSGVISVSVETSWTGDVVGLSQFLAELEHGPALLAVEQFSVTQADVKAPTTEMEVLHGSIKVKGLSLPLLAHLGGSSPRDPSGPSRAAPKDLNQSPVSD